MLILDDESEVKILQKVDIHSILRVSVHVL